MREFRGRNLNNEFAMKSISELGVSQIARTNAEMINAPYTREFSGLMIGIVAPDDNDPFMIGGRSIPGVIRVYIPLKSPPKEQLEIDMSKDKDKLYICFPIYPFAGSEVNGSGSGNSYGMAYTPSAGDRVAVFMANADTKTAFWIGCVPNVPFMDSAPGNQAQSVGDGSKSNEATVDGQGGDEEEEELPLPAGTSQDSAKTGKKVPRTITHNTKEAGLIKDPHRGPTPLLDRSVNNGYVFAIQSRGNPDMKRAGHMFAMSDDPRYSQMKLQTGEGNKIVMSDAIQAIYVGTKHGKNWMEFREDGTIDVYAEKSISFHAIEDINLHCGRDFNVGIGRDHNQEVKGISKLKIGDGYHIDITGSLKIKTTESIEMTIGTGYKVTAAEPINLKSSKNVNIDAGEELNLKAAGNMYINSDFIINTQAGATAADQAEEPAVITYVSSPAQPTPEQYRRGERGSDEQIVGGRDNNGSRPVHEPYEPSKGPVTTYDDPAAKETRPGNPDKSRTIRNNNPGGILGGRGYSPGAIGSDTGTVVFNNPASGFASQTRLLNKKYNSGRHTIQDIINGYAGVSGTTSQTSGYADFIAQRTGISKNQEITEEQWNDPNFRFKFQRAQTEWETGSGDPNNPNGPRAPFNENWKDQDLWNGMAMEGIKKENAGQKTGETVITSDGQPKTDTNSRGTQERAKRDPKGYRHEQQRLIDST